MAFENPSLSHNSLDATIIGVKIVKDGTEVIQFRGLQYARIERRFARPQIVTVGEAAKRTAQGGNSWLINGMSFGYVTHLLSICTRGDGGLLGNRTEYLPRC